MGHTRALRRGRCVRLRTSSAFLPRAVRSSVVENTRPSLRREGEYWTLEADGKVVRLRDSKGIRYLAVLLARPGVEIHVTDLAGAGPALAGSPLLDPASKDAYRRRLGELREEIDDAEMLCHDARAARARAEAEALIEHLARAVGLAGRDRLASSVTERARVNVTRVIRAAIATIGREHSLLGTHLDTTIATGTFCSYALRPGTALDWSL